MRFCNARSAVGGASAKTLAPSPEDLADNRITGCNLRTLQSSLRSCYVLNPYPDSSGAPMDDQTKVVETEEPAKRSKKKPKDQGQEKESQEENTERRRRKYYREISSAFCGKGVENTARDYRAERWKGMLRRKFSRFVGVGFNGPYKVELSSAIKYGFWPRAGHVLVTERARQAIRPQNPGDEIAAFREAVLAAPEISTVYSHYRGEYLPDGPFFENALVDKFGIPALKVAEFTQIFLPHSARQISLKRRATSFEFSILRQVPKKLPAPKV